LQSDFPPPHFPGFVRIRVHQNRVHRINVYRNKFIETTFIKSMFINNAANRFYLSMLGKF